MISEGSRFLEAQMQQSSIMPIEMGLGSPVCDEFEERFLSARPLGVRDVPLSYLLKREDEDILVVMLRVRRLTTTTQGMRVGIIHDEGPLQGYVAHALKGPNEDWRYLAARPLGSHSAYIPPNLSAWLTRNGIIDIPSFDGSLAEVDQDIWRRARECLKAVSIFEGNLPYIHRLEDI